MATGTDRILQIVVKARDEASAVMNKIGDNMSPMSARLVAAGAALTGLGIAGAKALNDMSGVAVEYASSVQTIQRLTGDSAEKSSELAAVFNRLGMSGDQSSKILKTLSTNINSNSESMQAMGIATTNADGSLRASGDVLKDVANYYANSTDKTAALANVSKVLGRSYADMLPALAAGGDYFEKTAEKAKKYGLVLTEDGLEANAKYKGALADNKMALLGLQVQFGMATLPIKTFIEEGLIKLFAAFNNLPEPIKKVIPTIALVAVGLALVAGPALMLIGFLPQMSAGMGILGTSMGKVGLETPALVTKFLALGTAQKVALLGGVGLIAGLVALGVYMATTGKSADDIAATIQGMADKVTAGVTALIQKLPGMINTFTTALTGIVSKIATVMPQVINTVVQTFIKIAPSLIALVPVLLQAALTLFKSLVQAATQILPVILQAVLQVVQSIVSLLPTLIPALLGAAVQLFLAIVQSLPVILPQLLSAAIQAIQAVVGMLPTLIPVLLDAAVQLFLAIVQSLPVILPQLLEAALQVIVAVVEMLPTLIPALLEAAIVLFLALVQAVPQILGALLGAIGDLLSQAGSKVSGAAGDMLVAAGDMMQGLVDGIWNAAGAVWDAITGTVSEAVDAVKRMLGIKSPSKVFREIGENTGLGLANGIAGMAPAVARAATGLAQSAAMAVSGTRLSLNASMTGGSFVASPRTGGTTVINNYQIGDITIPDGDKNAQDAIAEFVDKMKRYTRMQPTAQGAI